MHYLNTSRINPSDLARKPVSKPSRVMRRAWRIAERAADLFGGRKSDFFREALRQAWAEEKDPSASILNDIRQRKAAGLGSTVQRRGGYQGRNWYTAAMNT